MNLTQREIESCLRGRFGTPLRFLREVDSTNLEAKRWAAQGAPEGAVVAALWQSAGRGRQGRSFYSPDGGGLYFSLVLRPKKAASSATIVTAAAAVAVSRGIEDVCGLLTKIKWVNDIYANGKKLCGILAESAITPSGMTSYLVLGIGINVDTLSFPEQLGETVTSLSLLGCENVNPARLAASILLYLEQFYDCDEPSVFMRDYRVRSCVIGKKLAAIGRGWQDDVLAVDIAEDGALIVEFPNGKRESLISGEVSVKGDFT